MALIWDNLKTGNSLPFIFSLSSNGDLLSQWRAYARDGSGVSIGFNPRYFPKTKHLPHTNAAASENLTLFDVVYNEHQQNDFLRKTIIETLKAMKAKTEAEKARVVADATYALRGCSLFFKNPAFSEEAEWRLIHTPLIMGDKDNNTKIYGNISEIKQRVTNNRIYSYFEFDFSRNSNEKPILEIILGPKCEINDFDMSLFLSLNGFPDVKLKKSSASYR